MMLDVFRPEIAQPRIVADQVRNRRAHAHEAGRIAEYVEILAVPRDQVHLGIDHADPGIDILERGGEQLAREAQRLAALAEQPRHIGQAHLAARERRGDQRARRGGAHHAGDQVARALRGGAGDRHAGRGIGKFPLRPFGADKAGGQPREIVEIADLLLPAQLPQQRPRLHLARRDQAIGNQIAPQAPRDAVHQRRGVADAEQPHRIGECPFQHGQPAIGQDRRQGQRVEPQAEADREAHPRRQRIASAALGREDQVRGELRHRGKGDQPDRGQSVLRRDQQRPGKRGGDDAQDRGAPHAQHPPPERALRRIRSVALQQRGEDQVVRDHGGERGGIDDHHRCCRADPADQRQHQHPAIARQRRDLQHIEIGAGIRLHQAGPGQRDRQRHDRHDGKIGGETEARPVQRAAVLRFDQPHIELPGQRDDRHRGDQEDHRKLDRKPLGPEIVGEQRGTAVDRSIGRAHQQHGRDRRHCGQRNDLDHRFEPDRIDQPLAAPGQLVAARAEQDREQREQPRRANHRRIGHRPARGERERAADRAELQRDIGNGANERDQRHQPRDAIVVPEARGDEIGHGGRLLFRHGLGEPHEEARREQQQADRREIDRQIVPAIAYDAAHRAVEGPARAIDAERQRIGELSQPRSSLGLIGTPLDQCRHREQQQDDRKPDQCRRRQAHKLQRSSPQPGRARDDQFMSGARARSIAPDEQLRHRIDDRLAVEPIGAIQVGQVAGLAKAVGAQRADALAANAAEP